MKSRAIIKGAGDRYDQFCNEGRRPIRIEEKITSCYQLVIDCTLEVSNIELFSGGFGSI
jgi:hypothetical protein